MIKLPDKKFQIIYADPPWEYKSNECFASKKAFLSSKYHTPYSTLSIDEIKKIPIQNITDKNCLLFLWVVSPLLPESIEVLKTWGFQYATIAFVWHKKMINPGYYTLSECELCLVGKNGSIPQPRGSRNVRQFLSEKKTIHSRKPLEIKKRINLMFPTQDKIELFAREKMIGWEAWGNETDKFEKGLFKLL